ncbi:hypothetical protein [Desulfatirhabdium butyrativorans]|uniref:hypothetical protein n=1 Tax=Desulfatirhabdium butyrativorans TaxID=340467 RepID=UPI00048777D0|nr:hypothetical protein [Desulfatirhabdium butyrativorans]
MLVSDLLQFVDDGLQFCLRYELRGSGWIASGNDTLHETRQNDDLIRGGLVDQRDGMVEAEDTGFSQLGEPNNEVGVTGSDDSRLGLYAETFLTKILQGLNQKARLAGKQGDQTLSLFFLGFEQVVCDFDNGV